MAETRSRKNGDRKNGKRQKVDRKSQILSVLMMLFSILLVIGILTYSRSDEQFTDISLLDLFKLPFDDILKEKAAHVTNALSLVGALIANSLINGTIGYAVIILPILLMMWGWIILRKNDPTNALKLTNYAIVIAILFSATMGVTSQIFGTVEKEWSGLVGAFMGDVLTKLIGKVGAALIVLTSLLIILVLAVDLDIYKTLNRIKQGFDRIAGWFVSKKNEQRVVDLDDDKDDEAAETEFTIKKFDEAPIQQDEKSLKQKPAKQIIFKAPEEEKEEEKVKRVISTEKNVEENDVDEVQVEESESMPPESQEEEEIEYVFPSVELLDSPRQADVVNDEELRANAELLKSKLANFGIELESVSVTPGPVITLYELVPASGVKISRIVSLENDLALALSAKGIRIIAPIPGKGTIGVEIPNHNPSIVNIRSVLNSTKFRETKAALPLAMGKTISGEVFVDDLAKMPHLLIAGATGSGKSIGINSIIISLLYKLHPSEVKFVIIDPKKIELTLYKRLVNHYLATSSDFRDEIITTPENSVSILKSVEVEMEKRYNRFANAGARNIAEYNDKVKSGKIKSTPEFKHLKMPYIIVIIDELADLMITAAKEIEEPITRLAQMARAVGIHLVVATQRPSVDVITGVIKANFPARIAYQVASKTDSRTILDMNGAEALLGSGDMLYLPSGSPKPMRIQNVYVTTDEVEAIMNHIAKQKGYTRLFKLPSVLEKRKNGYSGRASERDELFEEAAHLVVRHQQASVSLIQRRQKVGYSRAARIVDELEAAGIVGPYDGSKARQVLIETEETLREILRNTE
ncbi:MAG: DNA translocase FtsK 4TM domain-containing protein [Bacteroidota bacterium]|nr:DNA translocase FtsK 4TM domain-containing protein [Bacteroidota bacterium]